MTEWKVYTNPMAGKKKYSLYKTIDPNKEDHSGNRKNYGVWYETRREAEERAGYLNIMEAGNAE